mmetsp:Transcript_57559/g.67192  ORF Transcript_57559/g.67192 Transcript_57559/m.67192 type:complete len:97 (+) Transcript_57559:79-369(+)
MPTQETPKKNNLNHKAKKWFPVAVTTAKSKSHTTTTPNNKGNKDAYWKCIACRMPRNRSTESACHKCHAKRGSVRKVRGESTAESTANFVHDDDED